MIFMKNRFLYVLISSSIFSYGQVSILSETNTKEYEVKEAFKLNIGLEILGNELEQQTPVKLPDLSKFEILGNASEIFSFIDPDTGMLVRQVVYQLVLEPKQAGKIKIGSALVQVNGKIYKSESFDIFVKENSKKENEIFLAKNVQLKMETTDNSYYIFEPVIITLKAHGKNFQNFRKINHIQLPQGKTKAYPIHTQEYDIEVSDAYSSQNISSFVTYPDKFGNYNIPPTLAKLENEKLSSNSLNINVKPLPQGAPENFKNAVGNFELEVIKPHYQAKINKAYDILIKLSGHGNFDHIELPKILSSNDYKILNKPKKISDFIATSKGLKGEITEHYILIPKKEGIVNINIEDFSFFNPKTNLYHNITKKDSIFIPNSTKDMKNSSFDKLMDDTENILKEAELSPISEEKEENKISWKNVSVGTFMFLLIIILTGIFIKFSRNRKKKASKILPESITTIAETEEILKHHLFIGKEYYFRSMKRDLDNNLPLSFFEHYDELHYDAEEQVTLESNKSIEEFLEDTVNQDFAQEFISFRKRILTEKYAPIHEDMKSFYDDIIKFYSKIMK